MSECRQLNADSVLYNVFALQEEKCLRESILPRLHSFPALHASDDGQIECEFDGHQCKTREFRKTRLNRTIEGPEIVGE